MDLGSTLGSEHGNAQLRSNHSS